jgi:hypothetical protein
MHARQRATGRFHSTASAIIVRAIPAQQTRHTQRRSLLLRFDESVDRPVGRVKRVTRARHNLLIQSNDPAQPEDFARCIESHCAAQSARIGVLSSPLVFFSRHPFRSVRHRARPLSTRSLMCQGWHGCCSRCQIAALAGSCFCYCSTAAAVVLRQPGSRPSSRPSSGGAERL